MKKKRNKETNWKSYFQSAFDKVHVFLFKLAEPEVWMVGWLLGQIRCVSTGYICIQHKVMRVCIQYTTNWYLILRLKQFMCTFKTAILLIQCYVSYYVIYFTLCSLLFIFNIYKYSIISDICFISKYLQIRYFWHIIQDYLFFTFSIFIVNGKFYAWLNLRPNSTQQIWHSIFH